MKFYTIDEFKWNTFCTFLLYNSVHELFVLSSLILFTPKIYQ